MNLEESLNHFMENKDMHCFLLRGQWGVGKTYAIDEWANKCSSNNKHVDIIRLPLFGISSINELNSLALNSSSLLNRFVDYLKSINQDVSVGVGPVSVSVPLIGVVANLLKKEYPNRKNKKYVFIIDDIERKDFKLSIEEIFGFVDQLPFENTKVILISNTDKLTNKNDKKSFKLFKEKVVQSEFYIEAPQEQVIKEVAGEKLFAIIKNHLEFVKNLRTIIKLKNILASIGEIDDLVTECIYLCLLSIDECTFSKERLKDIYIEEHKESEKIFGSSFEKRLSPKEVEEKVEGRLHEIKKDCDVFYENIKASNILPNFPQDTLKEDVTKIYNCVASASYDELNSIKIAPSNPYKPIYVSWDLVFYSSNPNKEYLKCMNEIRKMFGDDNYDQVKVFTTYYSIKFNCEKYIRRTKKITSIEKSIEKKCVRPVAKALINRDYKNSHDGLNSLFLTENIPPYLCNLETVIYGKCAENIRQEILKKTAANSLTIKNIDDYYEKMRQITEDNSIINRLDWDGILLSKIKYIYKLFSGNIESLWHEAHATFRWIIDHKNALCFDKTIEYIITESSGKTIGSLRLSFLSKYYGLTTGDN